VLGPHLFLLFINDINNAIGGTTRLFADDCLLYRKIQTSADESLLQKDLDILAEWAENWGMKFNTSKCNIMRISRKRDPGEPKYSMRGVNLEEQTEIIYLGIIIQNRLGWNRQTERATQKASRISSISSCEIFTLHQKQSKRNYTSLWFDHISNTGVLPGTRMLFKTSRRWKKYNDGLLALALYMQRLFKEK
jgi:hypothetical protein